MQKVYSAYEKFVIFVGDVSQWLIMALILVICYDVAMRYFINNPQAWAYETSYILGAWAGSLGFGSLYVKRGIVRVDIFYAHYGVKGQLICDILFNVLCFIPSMVVFTKVWIENVLNNIKTGEKSAVTTWYPKLWPIKGVICIGIILITIAMILDTLNNISLLIKEFKNPSSGKEAAAQ